MSLNDMSITRDDELSKEAADSKPHHKRNRPHLSCTNCRHAKLKCDRQQPCSQCAKRGKELQCTVPMQMPRRKPATSLQNRLKHLESLVKEVMTGQSPAATIPLLPDSLEQSVHSNNGQSTESPESQGVSGEEGRLPTSGQIISRAGEKQTYIGATHWAAILEDVRLSNTWTVLLLTI